jgi:Ser/Thr protein kinase RdoA (MazF antagonist)
MRPSDSGSGGRGEDVALELRKRFGFEEVVVGERMEGGYANDLFRLEADGRSLVLRLMHPPVDADDIAWEHRLVRLLAKRMPEVHAPIATPAGETIVPFGDRLGWLVPFVGAEPADPGRPVHRVEAARALGRLHRAGSGLDLPPRPCLRPLAELEWPPLRIPSQLQAWRATITTVGAWAVSFVSELADRRQLPWTLVHGDFFPGNLLVADDRAAAIIDWEEAQVDWATWDLASAIGSFCRVGDNLDGKASRAFVSGYRDAGGTAAPRDDDLLIPLVKVKAILEVLRAPTDRHPRWEHQRHNLRFLEAVAPRSL